MVAHGSEPTESTPPAKPTPRLGFIEGMRGIAAFYVVLQHICTLIDPQFLMMRAGAQPAWLASVMGTLWYGHFAVAAFIVLSGFCLQMSLYHRGDGQLRDLKTFLKRRCWRILPPYYACLAISLVVCETVTRHQTGLPWIQYLPVTTENVLAHIFMVHNLSREWMYKINGVLWSISIEFQLYFLFPIFAWAMWRLGGRVILPILTALVIALMIASPTTIKLYPWYGVLFVLGMAGARWALDERLSRPGILPTMVVGCGAVVVALLSIGWTKELYLRDSLMGIGIVCCLIAGLQRPDALWVRWLGCRTLVGLGAFSYSLYLMHHPILQALFVNRPPWFSTVTRQFGFLIACLPIILGLCYLFYLLFEKPFIHRGKRASRPAISE